MNKKVSIVIIGRNEKGSIGKCIAAAKAAAEQIGGAEMIYVDSHSTDGTVSVVEGLGVRVLALSADLRPSPSAGRFMGSHHARGEFILFLDADTLIYPDFLPKALEYFDNDPTTGGINGYIDDLNEAGEQVSGIEPRSANVADIQWLRGPCCFYRREALLRAGSFNPELACEEEAELGLRMISNGWKLKIIPQPMACHTRCYHGQTLKSIVSAFTRDIRTGRLGEVTKTIAYAFRAGNGLAFCWLRLKTTILFASWLLAMGLFVALSGNYAAVVIALLFIAVGLPIFVKKRSIYQTLLFFPSKALCVVDVAAGIHKIRNADAANRPIADRSFHELRPEPGRD